MITICEDLEIKYKDKFLPIVSVRELLTLEFVCSATNTNGVTRSLTSRVKVYTDEDLSYADLVELAQTLIKRELPKQSTVTLLSLEVIDNGSN